MSFRSFASKTLILIFCASSALASKNKEMVIGVADYQAKEKGIVDIYSDFIEKVLGNHAYKAKFIQAPFKRILFEMNSGVIDGNALRSRAIENEAKNIVRVPESLFFFSLFKMSKSKIDRKESNKGKHVAVVLGDKAATAEAHAAQLADARDIEHLVKLIDNDRVDFGIVSASNVQNLIALSKNLHIEKVGKPRHLYMYLNEKHRHLAIPLAKTMKKLKAEGVLRKIFEKHGFGDVYDLTASP